MALADVSNDPAHAKAFNIPGLTKPALKAEAKPTGKTSKASKTAKTAKAAAAGDSAKVTKLKKRAPGAKKAATLTTTPPPAAAKAKIAATENTGTPDYAKVQFQEAAPKTPYEPKTPYASGVVDLCGTSSAEDVTQQFKTPGNVTFAAHDDERVEEDGVDENADESVDANGKRVSRRQHAKPTRFGEFKSWNSVQKGTLGTPGHGLISKQARVRLGESRNESAGSSGGSSSSTEPSVAAQAAAAATPKTARFNAAASNAAARDVHERVAALMRMADAALPVEDPEAAAAAAVDEKSLREQLSDSWNGQGYYAKLMTQMATPKKEGEKPDEEQHAVAKQPNGAATKKVAKQQPLGAGAAAPLAVSGSGGAQVAKKLNGNALASRATANAGWMLAGVVSQAPKPASPAFGASQSESGEVIDALKRELEDFKAQLAAAKDEANILRSDAALAESEAESLGNTLESQTHQLRAKDAENKALKLELASLKQNGSFKEKAQQMAEEIKKALDAAVAKL